MRLDLTSRVIVTLHTPIELEASRLLLGCFDGVEVRTLRAFLPICSYCKRVRDDENYWHSVEAYVSEHTGTRFSHGICPSCYETKIRPGLDADDAR